MGKNASRARKPRHVVEPDDAEPGQVKIPNSRIPEPIMRGLRGWRTSDGWFVARVHYSADDERDEAWVRQFSQGYRGGVRGRDWQRELEIDFGSYQGDPVYPDFDGNRSIRDVRYNQALPLWRGWDFGYRNPAVVFMQYDPGEDQLRCLAELFPTFDKTSMPGINTPDLARMVVEVTESWFPGSQDENASAGVMDYCDPAGNQTKETSDFSSIEHLQTFGIAPEFSVVGRKNRIEYLRNYVEETREDGAPKFLIHPRCSLTIKALDGAYHYPEEGKGGVDRDMPDMTRQEQLKPYVHLMDAMEYAAAVELAVDDVVAKRAFAAKPSKDDGIIAGDTIARLSQRIDLVQLEDEQGRSVSDPEVFLDQLLGEEVDLEEAFEVL